MIAIAWAIASSLSAGLGGLVAVALRDKLHLVMGFSAGVLVTAALYDLLPAAVEVGADAGVPFQDIVGVLILGFLFFHVLDRLVGFHSHEEEAHTSGRERWVGVIGAGSFAVHSFFDGASIGLAFQVGGETGALVTLAVASHRFSDGINTMSIMLAHNNTIRQAFTMLLVAALAPILGAASVLLVDIPGSVLALLLPIFAGIFIYIGATDLLPEAYRASRSPLSMATTVAGAAFMFGLTRLLGA